MEIPELAEQLRDLHNRRAEIAATLRVIEPNDFQQRLRQLQRVLAQWDKAWEVMSPSEKRQALALVVAHVELEPN